MSNFHRQSGERGERASYSYKALEEGALNRSQPPARMNKRARQRAPVEGHERQVPEIAEQRQEMGNDPRNYRDGPFHNGTCNINMAPGFHVQERQRYPEERHNSVDIRDLTHEQLMKNPEYNNLLGLYTDLDKKYKDLSKAHEKLRHKDIRIEVDTPAPASRVSVPLTPAPISVGEIPSVGYAPSFPPLKQEDYPGIKFWSRASHKAYLAKQDKAERKARKESGENVASDFLEYCDGTTVDNETVGHMRKFIRSLLNERKHELPTKFSKFGYAQRQFFFCNLYEKFPFLRFCENDWKADVLAARTLNSYANSDKRRAKERIKGKGKGKAKGKGMAVASEEESSGYESSDELEDVDAETPPATPIVTTKSNNSKRKAPKQKGGQSKRSRQDVPAAESSRRDTRSLSTQDGPQANNAEPHSSGSCLAKTMTSNPIFRPLQRMHNPLPFLAHHLGKQSSLHPRTCFRLLLPMLPVVSQAQNHA